MEGSTGQNIDEYDEAVIIQRGQPEENEQRIRFRQTIHALILQVESIGVDETIKSFLMLECPITDVATRKGFSYTLPGETCTSGC